jgi:hypothetical protein
MFNGSHLKALAKTTVTVTRINSLSTLIGNSQQQIERKWLNSNPKVCINTIFLRKQSIQGTWCTFKLNQWSQSSEDGDASECGCVHPVEEGSNIWLLRNRGGLRRRYLSTFLFKVPLVRFGRWPTKQQELLGPWNL